MVVRECCVRQLARRVTDRIASRMQNVKQLALWKRKCLACETSDVGTFIGCWNSLQIQQKTYLEGKLESSLFTFPCFYMFMCRRCSA